MNPARLNHWSGLGRWSLAGALFASAISARFLLIGVLPAEGYPFLTFFPAVLLAAYLCGLRPGLAVAAASVLAAWYYFIPPDGFSSMGRGDTIALVVFAFILGIDCVVLHFMNKATMLLRQREEELREADRQKDLFIATLAHELRSPISAVLMGARLVERVSAQSAQALQASRMIQRQGTQLARLVDDLLTAARLRTGKFELRLDTVDVKLVLDAAVEAVSGEVQASGRVLSVNVSDDAMWTRGDAHRLVQCVSNLLQNAIKFTSHGGHISIDARPIGDQVLLAVSDDGEGISPAAIGTVFEQFMQETGAKSGQGLGLGLALTRQIISAHGGSIAASSSGKGMGTQVEIRLTRLPVDVRTGTSNALSCARAPLPNTQSAVFGFHSALPAATHGLPPGAEPAEGRPQT